MHSDTKRSDILNYSFCYYRNANAKKVFVRILLFTKSILIGYIYFLADEIFKKKIIDKFRRKSLSRETNINW